MVLENHIKYYKSNSTLTCSDSDTIIQTKSLASSTSMTLIYTYTANKSGLHIVNGTMDFAYASGGIRAYDISITGKTKNIYAQLPPVSTYSTGIPISFVVFLKPNDKISFYARQNSGQNLNVELSVGIFY